MVVNNDHQSRVSSHERSKALESRQYVGKLSDCVNHGYVIKATAAIANFMVYKGQLLGGLVVEFQSRVLASSQPQHAFTQIHTYANRRLKAR